MPGKIKRKLIKLNNNKLIDAAKLLLKGIDHVHSYECVARQRKEQRTSFFGFCTCAIASAVGRARALAYANSLLIDRLDCHCRVHAASDSTVLWFVSVRARVLCIFGFIHYFSAADKC